MQSLNQYGDLEHYRIEIRKLQQKLKKTSHDYEKRINELQNQIKHHRKPIFQNTTTAKPTVDLNFEIYQRDNTIKQLKNQNTKLRQVINNPDHILIKKQNNFELMTQKDSQINRLKKALLEIQSKYDGQFFNQHKVKKQNEMLMRENQSLKLHIRNIESQKKNVIEEVSSEPLESINYKKQLQMAVKQNQVLKKVILEQEQAYKSNGRVSQKSFQPISIKKSSAFVNTQMEEMKLEVEQYKSKNRELLKKLNDLTRQNEKLMDEKEKSTRLTNRDSKRVDMGRLSKIRQGQQVEEELIRSYKNRQLIRASFVQAPIKIEQTPKKNGRYSELGIDESYANRLSKVQNPIKISSI